MAVHSSYFTAKSTNGGVVPSPPSLFPNPSPLHLPLSVPLSGTPAPTLEPRGGFSQRRRPCSPRPTSITGSAAGSSGLYLAQNFELTADDVDLDLEDVRPYLIADGVVSLKLQGACGTFPSSTTMRMGIEKVLKEKFGEAIKDIKQVFEETQSETTAEGVDNHLNILRPAIKNFGGSVEVVSVEGGDCTVKYVGPDSIGSGIKAAIKEIFPDIVDFHQNAYMIL